MRSAQELRDTGTYPVMTPRQLLEHIEAAGPYEMVLFHPLAGGMEPGLAWRSLRLFEQEVYPQNRLVYTSRSEVRNEQSSPGAGRRDHRRGAGRGARCGAAHGHRGCHGRDRGDQRGERQACRGRVRGTGRSRHLRAHRRDAARLGRGAHPGTRSRRAAASMSSSTTPTRPGPRTACRRNPRATSGLPSRPACSARCGRCSGVPGDARAGAAAASSTCAR